MSQPPARFSYDELHYVGRSFLQTHPGNIASIALLHGLRFAPVDKCRVLEIACCDGNNLIPMAYTLPGSTFRGIDLASGPLLEGQRRVAALGLTNIRLEVLDVMDFPADAGEFDYIIIHGLYSWCPEAVRNHLMVLCGRHLSPRGIAFISFNAYPGYHAKELQRRLMLYHLSNVEPGDYAHNAQQALEALTFVALSQPEKHRCRTMLLEAEEFYRGEISKGPAGLAWFHHDLLETYNEPVYFHEFIKHAGQHGLQFLSDATTRVPRVMGFTPDTTRILESMNDNVIVQEQYIDFILEAPFRQVLLCREGVKIDRALGPERMQKLFIAGNLTEDAEAGAGAEAPADAKPEAKADAQTKATFSCPSGKIVVTHPAAKLTLRRIGEAWPQAVSFTELAALQKKIGTPKELAEFLLRLCVGKFANFRLNAYSWALTPGERPEASAVARLAAEKGPHVTTLFHTNVKLEPPLRHLLLLLDGRRDRPQLLAELREWISSGQAVEDCKAKSEGAADGEEGDTKMPTLETLETDLETTLQSLATLGLLLR